MIIDVELDNTMGSVEKVIDRVFLGRNCMFAYFLARLCADPGTNSNL